MYVSTRRNIKLNGQVQILFTIRANQLHS